MSKPAKCICGRCLHYCNPSLDGCLNSTYLPEPDPRVTQLIAAAREAKDTLFLIVDRLAAVSTQARCERVIDNLSSALKPFEK